MSRSRVHLVLPALLIILAAYGVLLSLAWRFQERVVYQPPRGIPREAVGAMQVTYTAADGTPVFAYVVGDPEHAARVVIALHGNADLARWLLPWAREVSARTGAAVFLPEYRGYDGVAGTPGYDGIAQDARAALTFVRGRLHVTDDRLVYFGHSLGTAVAAELAAEHAPCALVLQSPFTSATDMARRFPLPGVGIVWPLLARVHYDTVRRLEQLDVPVWVAHGDRDVIVPLSMGRRVFDHARKKGELLVVHGAGHNDVAELGGDEYWDFLSRAFRA